MNSLFFKNTFSKKNLHANRITTFNCSHFKKSYPVLIKVTNRKKTISIRIEKENILINTPCFVEDSYILDLLEKKRNWINDKFEKINSKKNNFIEEGKVFYLGKKYKIQLKKGIHNYIVVNNSNLEITNKGKDIKFKKILEDWYKRKCLILLEERLFFFSKKMKVEYKNFKIRSYKRRLGSCDSRKCLSFNWKLILMPKEIIDYVVIHELCHILHFNHSKLFWKEVSNYCPEYKKQKNWINENINLFI